MDRTELLNREEEKGFTLVELAIVMIIIGLLIGAILKGQELIANAQIGATVTQVKGIEAATSTFRDMYDAMPGDMLNPGNRLPNCTGACATVTGGTRGNSKITEIPSLVASATNTEAFVFWLHLSVADLLGGIDASNVAAFGAGLPASKVGGGFTIGYRGDGALVGRTSTASARAGHYLALRSDTGATIGATDNLLTTGQAARIDRKMDDGTPNGGSVRAIGTGSSAGCASSAAVTGVYNEAIDQSLCSLYIRIQQ